MKNKYVAIIQARMGSSRLPGKVLKKILGKPMLWYIVEKLTRVDRISKVVIATSDKQTDDPVIEFCRNNDISHFRGSESDVLSRFYHSACHFSGENVLRVTGDCPLIDSKIIDNLLDLYEQRELDYCCVATGAGVAKEKGICAYPDGVDTEVFGFNILKEAYDNARGSLYREHVTPFIWKNKLNQFKIDKLYSEINLGDIRLTVDNVEDFNLVTWVYENLYAKDAQFSLKEVLSILSKAPKEILANQKYIGQENYKDFY